LGAGLLVGLLAAAHKPLLLAMGDFLVVGDALEPADVIHVMAGPIDRAAYAVDLYQQGYGRQLLVTGPWSPRLNMTHAEFVGRYALARGVPEADLHVDGSRINSTYSEAMRLRHFLESSPTPIESVIVVSDPHHMWRTRWTYRRVLDMSGVRLQMAPVPFEQSRLQRLWWTDALSVNMVFREYIKIGYYHVRYVYSPESVRGWLVPLDEAF
jgi:uncharacterized SAM-binding protein YcdF (DUF218 family)